MWSVFHTDREDEFGCVRVQFRDWLRWWSELLLDASPTMTKCAVGKVRAGRVEAEEFVEYGL